MHACPRCGNDLPPGLKLKRHSGDGQALALHAARLAVRIDLAMSIIAQQVNGQAVEFAAAWLRPVLSKADQRAERRATWWRDV